MKALKISALGFLSFVLVCMGLAPAALAGDSTTGQETPGSSVVAVYHHFGGKMTEQFNVGDKTTVKFINGKADTVWEGDVCKMKYVYGNGGFLSQIIDLIGGGISFFLGNGKKAMDVTGAADMGKVAGVLNELENAARTGNYAAVYTKVMGEIVGSDSNSGIKGIDSIVQYDNNGNIVGVQKFDVAAKGTKIQGQNSGNPISSDRVIIGGYTSYENGRPVAEYASPWTCVDKDGKEVTNDQISNTLNGLKTEAEKDAYLASLTWKQSSENGGKGRLTAKYNYVGNSLVSIDRYDANGSIAQKQIFENGRISMVTDGKGTDVGHIYQKYNYSGSVLVSVSDYTNSNGEPSNSVVSTTYFDKYGREAFTKDSAGNVTSWIEYNDTNQPVTTTITDADVVAQLKSLFDRGEMTNVSFSSDGKSATVTTKPGQMKAKYTKNDPTNSNVSAAPTFNITLMNQLNMAALTYQTSNKIDMTGPQGKDPVAQCKLSIGMDGQVEALIDLSTLHDPTGKVSDADLLKDYGGEKGENIVTIDGKQYVKVKVMAISGKGLVDKINSTHYSKTVDPNSVQDVNLQKQIVSDAMLGKTDTFRWNFTAKAKDGSRVILVEERLATF